MRQLKRASVDGSHWTKRPSKQASGQHMRSWPPACSAMLAWRHSQRCGSRKKASNTACGGAFTSAWKTKGARVFSGTGVGFVLPADPLRAVAPDLFLPDRHDLLEAVDGVLGSFEG